MAALAQAYPTGDCGCGRRAAAEEIVMMLPDLRSFIPGRKLLMVRKVAVRFPSMEARQSSSLIASSGAGLLKLPPPFATRMSTGPSFFSVSARIASISANLVSSAATAMAVPPAPSISARTADIASRSRPWITTLAPCCANERAIAAPIPRELPVITATLPLSVGTPFTSEDAPNRDARYGLIHYGSSRRKEEEMCAPARTAPCYSVYMVPIGFNAGIEAAGLVEKRLREQGIELPTPSTPGADYVPFVRMGELLFLTGQVSQWNGERKFIGKVGREIGLEQARQAARLCALNLLAHLRVAVDGNLDRVVQCIRVGGFVNATPEFLDYSKVINGASELFLTVFGDAGKHTRVSVGVNGLPYGVAVEVEAIFAVRD